MENKYKLKYIKYTANAFTRCPIGKEWGRMFIEINAEMGSEVPDYCDIDTFIQTEIDGHILMLEEVGCKVYDFFKQLCQPKHLSVTCHDESNAFNTTWVTIEED